MTFKYDLGISYRKGRNGCPKDEEEAIKWLQKSADQGHVGALYKLGVFYYEKKDWEKAYENFKKAANAREESCSKARVKAQYSLGVLIYEGLGRKSEPKTALEYWEEAAVNGHEGANYNIGVAYAQGIHGYLKDLKKAKDHFEKGAGSRKKPMDRTGQKSASDSLLKHYPELF